MKIPLGHELISKMLPENPKIKKKSTEGTYFQYISALKNYFSHFTIFFPKI